MQTTTLLGIFFSFLFMTRCMGALELDRLASNELAINQSRYQQTNEDPTSNRNWVIIHGAMMSAAVVLFFPCGILMARHIRWILKDANLPVVELWFHLHRGVQVLGFIVFMIGIAFAYTFLDVDNLNGLPGIYTCGQAHMVLGTIVAGLLVLQVILGLVRPQPGPGALRSLWRIVHQWMGRLAIGCSWVVVLLGIYIGHSSNAYLLEYRQWLIPTVVVMGFWVILDIALSILAIKKVKQLLRKVDRQLASG